MPRPLLLGSIALGVFASICAAQEEPPLHPGSRIRVTIQGPEASTRIGRLGAVNDSTLVLLTASSSTAIPRAGIIRLELSRGRKPSVPGGIAGLVLGAAAGGAVGCLANRDSYGVFCAGQSDTKVVVGAVVGGAAGATLGALLFRRERWVTLPQSP
jgi:hypothetical protein